MFVMMMKHCLACLNPAAIVYTGNAGLLALILKY